MERRESKQMEISFSGPLLDNLVDAHRRAEAATAYPELAGYATALADRCEELDSPLVWPVGEPAERLAGAAVLASEGRIRLRGWSDHVAGERVLVIAVAHVSPLEMVQAADHARAIGADEVHACGAGVAGLGVPELATVFDSRAELTPDLVPA
jgi:hypothetical protein